MPAPVISWRKTDNTLVTTGPGGDSDFGNVDVGTNSATKTWRLWNNYLGGSAVSDAEQCKLTTWNDATRVSNSNIGTPAPGWAWVKQTFYDATPVTGTNTNVGDGTKYSLEGNGGVIGGAINGHYAACEFYLAVPSGASAGTKTFVWTLEYKYV